MGVKFGKDKSTKGPFFKILEYEFTFGDLGVPKLWFSPGDVFSPKFLVPLAAKLYAAKNWSDLQFFLPSIDVFSVLTAFFPDNLASLAPVR